ncbi:hypothetical protein [Ferruginibacter sp.]
MMINKVVGRRRNHGSGNYGTHNDEKFNFKIMILMTIKRTLFIVSIAFSLLSCGAYVSNIASGSLSKTTRYKMYNYASSCCGCKAEYFNIYNSTGEIKEQVVYTYNCYSHGMPTKFVFNYDEYGRLIYCSKLVATTEDDFEEPLNESERTLLDEINKTKVLTIQDKIVRYSAIKGFRKPRSQEITHEFPLAKKSFGVPVK